MNKRGKTIVSAGVLFILIVSISAYFVLAADSNTKTYDAETKTVTVKSNENNIAKITLDTPLIYNVIRGKDRLVAEFTIENINNYNGEAFNNLEFYNLKEGSKKINREFTYKYKIKTGTKEVPYYEEVCEEKLINGTNQNICTQKIAGYNNEDIYEWKNLEPEKLSGLSKGKIIVGVFTEVKAGDYIEWVPTLYGVKVNEWAVWEEGLTNGLVAYYGFNEGGGTKVAESVFGIYNGTTNGWTSAGKNYNSSGYNNKTRISSSQANFNGTQAFSVSFWINRTTDGFKGLIGTGVWTVNPCWGIDTDTGDKIELHIQGSSGYPSGAIQIDFDLTSSIQYGKWQLYTFTYDGRGTSTGINFYLDGVNQTNRVVYQDHSPSGSYNSLNFTIGTDYITSSTYRDSDSSIDEVAIWNRNLSASEASDLYNAGAGIFYQSDSVTPVITRPEIIPVNPSSSQNLDCYATLTDDKQTNLIAYWKWYKNNILYSSGEISVVSGTNSLITTINSGNISKGEEWICEVLPFDGYNYGESQNSSEVTILNSAPTQTAPLLSTPSASHPSNENLTCLNQSTYDSDGDVIVNIYNWFKDGISLLSLNLPFEINSNDYSGNGNDAIVNGTTSADGKIGKGLSFDGNGYLTISDDNSIDFSNEKTWEIWFKRNSTGAETIFDKGNGTQSNYKLEFISDDKLKFSYSLTIGDVVNSQLINTENQFNEGTYSNVNYNSTISGARLLSGQMFGNYISKIFNAGSNAVWNNLSWNDNVGAVLTLVDVGEGIYKSTNQGLNWTLINSSYGGSGSAVELIESINGTLYIVNDAEQVWKSVNFGVSWTKETNDLNGAETSNAVAMTGNKDYLYVIQANEGVWRSDNEGVNWTKVNNDLDSGTSTSDVKGSTMDSNGNIFAVNNDGQVYKSTDNGVSWINVNNDYNGAYGNSATDLNIGSNGDLYILNMQEIWKSSDNGVTWTRINDDFNLADSNNGLAMTTDINNFIYIVDSSEDIYRSTDGGVSWSLLISNMNGARGDVMSIVAYDQPTAKFQVKSCDDNLCSGESFVGPDGTGSTYYVDSPENLNLANNQYFQFKIYFETYDLDYSPEVYNINFDYTTQSTDLNTNLISETAITDNNWHLATVSYSDLNSNNFRLYLDGVLDANKTETRTSGFLGGKLIVGNGFEGTLDEFRIYDIALSPEQISADYNLEYNKWVAEETIAGESYICQITPNDGEADGTTLSSNELDILVSIIFNITDSYYGTQLNNVLISCNSTNFSQLGDTTNTYGPYGFAPGIYSCEFSILNWYEKDIIFNANVDKTINVPISAKAGITIEEHTWLEAIYNCLYSGNCSLYNLLLEVNNTVSKIWENTKPTDSSVITKEEVTNKIVDSTHNLTIDYTVYIPIKAGYSLGDYLPVRIGYWFLNDANTTCYNQGEKPTGVEDPYCQPLIIETLGPMGGTINFTVKLHPELASGNYSIKRIIDIDPSGIWYNYGQEAIGSFAMLEGLNSYDIALQKTGEVNPSITSSSSSSSSSSSNGGGSSGTEKVTNIYNYYNTEKNNGENSSEKEIANLENNKPTITGSAISNLLSKGNVIVSMIIIGLVLVAFIVSRTVIKLKKK
jgi:photosystem II stability/assembly factor-like uncharacterized protein